MSTDNPFEMLITQLIKLPGIGRKAAQRIAFFLMNQSRMDAVALAKAIVDVKDKLKPCSRCNTLLLTR